MKDEIKEEFESLLRVLENIRPALHDPVRDQSFLIMAGLTIDEKIKDIKQFLKDEAKINY